MTSRNATESGMDLAYDREALAMDLSTLKATMPVLLGSGSTTTTVSVHMLDRLYRAALAASEGAGLPASLPTTERLASAMHDEHFCDNWEPGYWDIGPAPDFELIFDAEGDMAAHRRDAERVLARLASSEAEKP